MRGVTAAVSSLLVGKTAGQLGVWLRQELIRRGYDLQRGGQSRFARESDIHVSIINRVINRGQGVETDVLRRIGAALGYNLGEMLVLAGIAERSELPVRSPQEVEEAPPAEPDTNPYTDRYERQIWEMDGLSESVRWQVIRYLRFAIEGEHQKDARPDASVHQIGGKRSS
jgi:hypothetical protein